MDKLFENKWVLRGTAFVIALMLWMVVSMDQQSDANFAQTREQVSIDNVPVEPIYDEEAYTIIDMQETVQVILFGRRALLNATMLSQNETVYADLTDLGAGEHEVPLFHDGFPAEVDVDIIPETIRVVLEENEAQAFPVEVELTGELPEGYEAEEEKVLSPDQVHVIAPTSIIEEVAYVRGQIDIDGMEESVQETVDLQAYDEEGNVVGVEISPAQVEVEIPILGPNTTVPLHLEPGGELPDGLSLSELESEVDEIQVFTSSEEKLEDVTAIEEEVDLSQVHSSQTVEVDISAEEDWVGTRPSSVEVDVFVDTTEEMYVTNLPVQIDGLAVEYDLAFINPASAEVSLTLLASRERLDDFDESDIDIVLDVEGLEPGEHEKEALIQLSPYYQHVPEQIMVEFEIREKEDAAEE